MSYTIDTINDKFRVMCGPDVIALAKTKEDAELFGQYKTNEVILVYSGGLDSTTVLYDLIDRWYKVIAMSVNYGQKHSQELEKAKEICKKLNIEQIELDLSNVSIFQTNGLVNKDMEIKDGLYDIENIQSTMVLNRNSILANYALAYAMNRKAIGIALWIHSEDQSTWEIEYPDCSPEFVSALKVLAKQIDFRPYEVIVPFSGKHKGDVVKRGLELQIPYEDTWSCYKGENKGACGKCGTCVQRLNAFLSNWQMDVVKYQSLTQDDLELIWFDFSTLKQEKEERIWSINHKNWYKLEIMDVWNWFWSINQ